MTPAELLVWCRTPAGKKLIRYATTSVICAALSSTILAILVGILRWQAFGAALTATAITTVPSYMLNRRWAWGKSGKSHLWKEIVPFWVLAFIGLAFSTATSVAAQSYANHEHFAHVLHTAVIVGAFVGGYGVLWLGKFLIINKYLFPHDRANSELVMDAP
jgi:putative flippase GtrA